MPFGNFGSLLALLLLAFFRNRLVCRVNGGFASIKFLDEFLGCLVAFLSGLPNLCGLVVGTTRTKANGGSYFVTGLTLFSFRKFFLKLRLRCPLPLDDLGTKCSLFIGLSTPLFNFC